MTRVLGRSCSFTGDSQGGLSGEVTLEQSPTGSDPRARWRWRKRIPGTKEEGLSLVWEVPKVERRRGEREVAQNHLRPCSHGRKSGFQTHRGRKSEDVPSRRIISFQCYLDPSDQSVEVENQLMGNCIQNFTENQNHPKREIVATDEHISKNTPQTLKAISKEQA